MNDKLNTLKITIPYSYVKTTVPVNWSDISLAISNSIFDPDAAIEHAVNEVEKRDFVPQSVLELALLSLDDVSIFAISQHLNTLTETVSKQELNQSKTKLLYLLLKWVYDNKEQYCDPLGVVECIYDDFGFPESIVDFVRYMPMQGLDLGSTERNLRRLYSRWKRFLDDQHVFWKKTKND